MTTDFARVGGYLCLLTFCHFAVDWICQSHDEAMRKTREWRVRARHCLIYTIPFAVILFSTSWNPLWSGLMTFVIFLSHFVEDTYLPILWWAKYVRRPPQMARRILVHEGHWVIDSYIPGKTPGEPFFSTPKEYEILGAGESRMSRQEAQRELDLEGFVSFVTEPLGKILLIAVDQIVHIAFLLPAAYMLAAQP